METESLLGRLPDSWIRTTLGDACSRGGGNIQTGPFGSQLHASDYVPVGIPSIMPQNIGNNRIVIDGIARITPEDAERLGRYRVQPGDIVYSRRGDVERRALIRNQEDGWLCGTGCLRVRLGQGIVDPLYASYYLGHPGVRQWVVRHAVGATMPNLNTSILSALPFVIPPLSEQRTIAAVLGALDDKIELNNRMNQTLEQIAQAMFKSWFVAFEPVHANLNGEKMLGLTSEVQALFPSSFEESEFVLVPQGWQVVQLRDVVELNPARPLRQGQVAAYLDMANMPTASARALEVVRRPVGSGARFANGDVLLARITPCLENGKTAYVDFLSDGEIGWGSTEYIVMKAISPLPTYYAYFLARLEDFRAYAIQNMTGTSGRQRVPAEAVARFPVVVPDPHVASEFGRYCQSIFDTMKANDEQSSTLAAIRDALIPKLLSGEMRIVDVDQMVRDVIA